MAVMKNLSDAYREYVVKEDLYAACHYCGATFVDDMPPIVNHNYLCPNCSKTMLHTGITSIERDEIVKFAVRPR
jgi:DNA-directed RNA polymerase subunit RPC12/RpoP